MSIYWIYKQEDKRNVISKLKDEQGYRCAYCKNKFNKNNRATIDHVVPISKGGSNHLGNLVAACAGCNRKKGSMIIEPKIRPGSLDYENEPAYKESQK